MSKITSTDHFGFYGRGKSPHSHYLKRPNLVSIKFDRILCYLKMKHRLSPHLWLGLLKEHFSFIHLVVYEGDTWFTLQKLTNQTDTDRHRLLSDCLRDIYIRFWQRKFKKKITDSSFSNFSRWKQVSILVLRGKIEIMSFLILFLHEIKR